MFEPNLHLATAYILRAFIILSRYDHDPLNVDVTTKIYCLCHQPFSRADVNRHWNVHRHYVQRRYCQTWTCSDNSSMRGILLFEDNQSYDEIDFRRLRFTLRKTFYQFHQSQIVV